MTARAIDAAWPAWWSEEASTSPAASAELRFTLARRLGLSAQSLLDDRPVFLWRDEARYKSLTASIHEQEAIASFGVSLARLLITAAPEPEGTLRNDPREIRGAMLQSEAVVSFNSVVALAWAFGIPVVFATILPTQNKRMQAMSVRVDGRFAIIVGRRYTHRAHAAYAVAHELAHCLLGHLDDTSTIVELDDPVRVGASSRDDEEFAADRFALELLTGSPRPEIEASQPTYSATQLAHAAMVASQQYHVDPGVLALCLGHVTGRWRQTFGALKIIPPGREDMGAILNVQASTQLDRGSLSSDGREYLDRALGWS